MINFIYTYVTVTQVTIFKKAICDATGEIILDGRKCHPEFYSSD